MTPFYSETIDTRPQLWPEFYSAVGVCVTSYQSVEELVEAVFNVAMGGPTERNKAVYGNVRGLDNRLKVTTAALINHAANDQAAWRELAKRITDAASFRNNEVAHAKVGMRGGGIVVDLDDNDEVISAQKKGPDKMELYRTTKGGEITTVQLDRLQAEYVTLQEIERDVLAFIATLRA